VAPFVAPANLLCAVVQSFIAFGTRSIAIDGDGRWPCLPKVAGWAAPLGIIFHADG